MSSNSKASSNGRVIIIFALQETIFATYVKKNKKPFVDT